MTPELLQRLAQSIRDDPSDIPSVIDAIKIGLDAFIEGEKRKRDPLARNAVVMMMAVVGAKAKGKPVGWLIDAAYHQFAGGTDRRSPAELKFWDAFLDAAEKDGDRQRPECYASGDGGEWWDRVVVPALAARKKGATA